MSEQEITADRLEVQAGLCQRHHCEHEGDYRRAARTIRRLEGEVARLDEAAKGWYEKAKYFEALVGTPSEDAELGSLVRRIREHPEAEATRLLVEFVPRGNSTEERRYHAKPDSLQAMLADLNNAATRRAAEEGERGPSGWSYRMRDGALQTRCRVVSEWVSLGSDSSVPYGDLDVVERVRKGVPRGE